MSALEDRQLKYFKTGIDFVLTSVKAVLDHYEGDDKEKYLENQKNLVLEYLKMEIEYTIGRSILKELQNHLEVKEGTMDTDMEKEFKKKYEEELKANANRLDEKALKKLPRYKELEQIIKARTGEGVGDADDDLVLDEETNVYLDPWSKKQISIPVRNNVCNHIYDKATALKMCSRTKGKVKCPVIGCANNNVKSTDLQEDQQIMRIIESQTS